MKFKVKQIIEAEFNADKFDKELMFDCISNKYNDCVFDPIKFDAEELSTITCENGDVLMWNKEKRKFLSTQLEEQIAVVKEFIAFCNKRKLMEIEYVELEDCLVSLETGEVFTTEVNSYLNNYCIHYFGSNLPENYLEHILAFEKIGGQNE